MDGPVTPTPLPSGTNEGAKPASASGRRWSGKLAVFLLIVLAVNYGGLKMTGRDVLAETFHKAGSLMASARERVTKPDTVSVSETEFERLWEEIAPELLTPKGVPFEKAYEDMLKQFAGETIDEAFVRKLLIELKKKERLYDGNGYFRSDGKSDGNAPPAPIDPKAFEDDTVSIRFYLDNERFYSPRIFEILTKQKAIAYAHEQDENGYVFKANADIAFGEALKIASDGTLQFKDAPLGKGSTFSVPAEHLRKVPRLFQVVKPFIDHLGKKRSVTAYLDLQSYDTITAEIQTLPDGTLLANEHGTLMVSKDEWFVQRVGGVIEDGPGWWQYAEDGKVQLRVEDNVTVRNAFGDPAKTTNAQVLVEKETGRHILQVWISEGTWSLKNTDGTTWRTVDREKSVDAGGKLISDANDLGEKLRTQVLLGGKQLTVQPNLDQYVRNDAFLGKLVADVTAPYGSPEDKAAALLAFTQSFRYQLNMVPGSAKTPKEFMLSLEGDCEDASIFTVSLWTAAEFDAGFLFFRNRDPGKPGHAAPVIASDGCCTGAGYKIAGKSWVFGEATSPDWRLGADPNYKGSGQVLYLFQPHGGTPKPLSAP